MEYIPTRTEKTVWKLTLNGKHSIGRSEEKVRDIIFS